MEIKKQLNDYIVTFENFLPEKINKSFLEICKSKYAIYKDATIIENNKPVLNLSERNVKTWYLVNVNAPNLTTVHWANFFVKYLSNAFAEYPKKNNLPFFKTQVLDVHVLRYEKGGFYKLHVDHGSTTPRTLSAIYFVNDDYEGGELIFNFGEQEFIYAKKKNSLVVWPSNFMYTHRVSNVTKGERYTIVSWAL